MPGITLHFFKDQERGDFTDRGLKILYSQPSFQILLRANDNYPVQKIDTPDFVAFVEGKIYGEKIEGTSFTRALESIWKNEPDASNYFWKLDGEFVIFIASNSTDKVIIINDFLGRLPVYMHTGDPLIISRDLLSICEIRGGLEFDHSGVYQYLRLGFPLGKRTLYQDIEKVRYKSLFQIDSGKVKHELGPEWNIHGSAPLEAEAVNEIYEHFQTAIKSRSNTGKTALSLSGGLDSRAILGCLEKANLECELFTFHYSNPIIDNDLHISEQLAELYNKPLNQVSLEEWSPQNFKHLIKAKMGMNYLGMAFIYEFLKNFDDVDLMLTGDGGDKTLAPLNPLLGPGQNNFIHYVLSENQIASSKELARILDCDPHTEETKIADHLSELPGINTREKYKSFLLFERGMNWLFEGEDRNREMVWSTTPFYNPNFFELAHQISETDKANYVLFRKFLEKIDPDLNKISNANWGIQLEDSKQVRQLFLKQKIKRVVKKFYPARKQPTAIDNQVQTAVLNQLTETKLPQKQPFKQQIEMKFGLELSWHLLTLAYAAQEIDDK